MNFNFSTTLRWLGGGALILGALIYMVQGINIDSPMERHWIFLAVTGILTTCGVMAGRIWDEVKGARTFLGLAAATLPVHFSQLGAMLYSLVHDTLPQLPKALTFAAQSGMSVAVTAAVTLLVCVPAAHLAFSIFARHRARMLTGFFLLTSVLILPPFREPLATLITLASALGIFAFLSLKHFAADARMKTLEASFARLMLFTPALVITGRALFYNMDATTFGTISMLFGAYMFFVSPIGKVKRDTRSLFRVFGGFFMAGGYVLAMLDILPSYFSSAADTLVLVAPLAIGMHIISRFCESNGRLFRIAGSWLGVYAIVACAGSSSVVLPIIAALIGTYLISRGIQHHEKQPLIAGTVGLAVLGLSYLSNAFTLVTVSPWIALIVAGILLLAMATFYEKKAATLQAAVKRYRTTFESWA